MKYKFKSKFKNRITGMLEFRISLQQDITGFGFLMGTFDRFCLNHFPEEISLTKELAFAWCNDAKGYGGCKRASTIHRFGEYLISIGEEAYLMSSAFFPQKKAEPPYIFSEKELKSFFETSDCYPGSKNSPLLEYTIPVIFRLQYACGMRPQEIRLLKRLDFNFTDNTIYIEESKEHKDRRLVVNADIMDMCRKYDRIAELSIPNRVWFFQSPRGSAYSSRWLSDTFHRCWELSGNDNSQSSCVPYDLRHNYATQTMMNWIEEGKDLNAMIPYLSTYMGHENFSSTFYYIHLLPERLRKMDFTDANHIIPEVTINEEIY
jgi:integrase